MKQEPSDPRKRKVKKKKAYRSPTITSSPVFYTKALACDKVEPAFCDNPGPEFS